jgi:tight adherence protein C
MMLLLYYCFFCSITLLIYGLIIRSGRSKRMQNRITSYMEGQPGQTLIEQEDEQTSLLGRLLRPIVYKIKQGFRKKMPGDKVEKLELILLRAGRPFNMTAVDFRLMQITLTLLLPVGAWFYAALLGAELGSRFIIACIGLIAAVLLPKLYLRMKMKKRYALALRELPDVLDLLTVSLEAGLGFDAALSKLVSKKSGILAVEFQRCLEEIRLGRTRREALVGVRDRLDMDEVKALISSILQAEKLGIGMVQVLRVQSLEAREQRKQRAEEAAMKAPIKMLFPLVLFIFPCLFIILLGPVVIQFLETFGN